MNATGDTRDPRPREGDTPPPDPPRRAKRLRPDLPFQRIALVLSGGGALAAYEIGGLAVLEHLGLRPAILAGVSSGAMNAVLWVAHGFRTERLAKGWRALRASSIGMRWQMLAWRSVGSFLVGLALLELVLALAGSTRLRLTGTPGALIDVETQRTALVLEGLAWAMIAFLGLALLAGSREAEKWIARWRTGGNPDWRPRWVSRLLIVGITAHLVTWLTGWPYPHRFSATVLVLLLILWLAEHPGRIGQWMRSRIVGLLPEGGGMGLWGSEARRRLLRRWVAAGDPRRLVESGTHLIMSACDVDTGRMHYFVNWSEPDERFAATMERVRGEVVPLGDARSVVEAAVASSAVPMLFEPVEMGGHRYVDGGVFSNQPLHAVLADGADALIVVLLSPGSGPSPEARPRHLMGLGFRLLEIANWRDLQAELADLPQGWTRDPHGAGTGARVCVVEPREELPGGMYGYSNETASELIGRGADDMWRALEHAGWLVDAEEAPAEPVAEEPRPRARGWRRFAKRRSAAR